MCSSDLNGSSDIFIRDRVLQRTDHVSTSSAGVGGDGDSDAPSLSGTGLAVVYGSLSTNLVAGDTNGLADVFVGRRSGGALGGPTLSAQSTAVPEGSTTSPGTLRFAVALSAPSTSAVTFEYWLEPVTALAGSDFMSPYTGRGTIPAGATTTGCTVRGSTRSLCCTA